MRVEQCIADANMSRAWCYAVRRLVDRPGKELVPFSVAITSFQDDGQPCEDIAIRRALNQYLASKGKQSIEKVANTIFPWSQWNRAQPRGLLFDRYRRILPRLRKASRKNQRGLYFERMICGGAIGQENQLDFVLTQYTQRRGVRRSALQIGVFQPAKDHSPTAQLGFPCLQHVTFAPTDKGLFVNAMYASQYLIERAYGNYLGLCRLGAFVAHELNTTLRQVTCFSGILHLDCSKRELRTLLASMAPYSIEAGTGE